MENPITRPLELPTNSFGDDVSQHNAVIFVPLNSTNSLIIYKSKNKMSNINFLEMTQ